MGFQARRRSHGFDKGHTPVLQIAESCARQTSNVCDQLAFTAPFRKISERAARSLGQNLSEPRQGQSGGSQSYVRLGTGASARPAHTWQILRTGESPSRVLVAFPKSQGAASARRRRGCRLRQLLICAWTTAEASESEEECAWAPESTWEVVRESGALSANWTASFELGPTDQCKRPCGNISYGGRNHVQIRVVPKVCTGGLRSDVVKCARRCLHVLRNLLGFRSTTHTRSPRRGKGATARATEGRMRLQGKQCLRE